MKDVDIEVASIAAAAIATKHQASVANPPGTRRKKYHAKQRRKLAKKSRKRNRK